MIPRATVVLLAVAAAACASVPPPVAPAAPDRTAGAGTAVVADPVADDLFGPAYPMQASVSRAVALFHFVDALAGSSPAKTVPAWQRQYAFVFGALTAEDKEQLRRFREWRVRALRTIPVLRDGGVTVDPGSVPLMLFAQGPDVETALANLRLLMPPAEVEPLRQVLVYFDRRHERIWRDGRVAHEFVERARRDPLRHRLARLLAANARMYGVAPPDAPRPVLVFVPVLGGFGTHAQALGRYLLLEVREGDSLRDQAAVIAHENAHMLWHAMGPERKKQLEAAALAEGPAGARAVPLLREALPTALGQGIAERELAGVFFSTKVPWYHVPDVDAYAKALAPLVDRTLRTGGRLDEEFMRRAVQALPGDWK